jgi:hypothetical protein
MEPEPFFVEEGNRVEQMVREGRYGYDITPEYLAALRNNKRPPTYMVAAIGGLIVPSATEEVLHIWESDPDNDPVDWEFIELMQRTDHKPGSFFILIYPQPGTPGYGHGYYWRFCTPDLGEPKSEALITNPKEDDDA